MIRRGDNVATKSCHSIILTKMVPAELYFMNSNLVCHETKALTELTVVRLNLAHRFKTSLVSACIIFSVVVVFACVLRSASRLLHGEFVIKSIC